MALTKEQWADIEQRLSNPFGRVKLRCDGHEITAAVERGSGLRYAISVYIDGWIKGGWLKESYEPARKFWRLRKRHLHSAAKRAEFAKEAKRRAIGPELRELYRKSAEAHIISVEPYWPNAKDFCRHLRKTCQSIELVEAD